MSLGYGRITYVMSMVGLSLALFFCVCEAQGLITLEYPEISPAISHLHSTSIVGVPDMTYCSLITRTNLQRFTGLPLAQEHNVLEDSILQGDAIRLIEQGIYTDTFLPVKDFSKDLTAYLSAFPAYSLFDLYLYTPFSGSELTEKQYLFQGHRVVLLYAQDTWRVMDPLRGTRSLGWQLWDMYKQTVDETTALYLYNHIYEFLPSYEQDLTKPDLSTVMIDTTDLDMSLYQGVIVPELDSSLMPVATSILKSIRWTQENVTAVLPAGLVMRSQDSSPFHVGMMDMTFQQTASGGVVHVFFPGKDIGFSTPMTILLDTASLGSAKTYKVEPNTQYAVGSKETCVDNFGPDGTVTVVEKDGKINFSVCRTGVYAIVGLE